MPAQPAAPRRSTPVAMAENTSRSTTALFDPSRTNQTPEISSATAMAKMALLSRRPNHAPQTPLSRPTGSVQHNLPAPSSPDSSSTINTTLPSTSSSPAPESSNSSKDPILFRRLPAELRIEVYRYLWEVRNCPYHMSVRVGRRYHTSGAEYWMGPSEGTQVYFPPIITRMDPRIVNEFIYELCRVCPLQVRLGMFCAKATPHLAIHQQTLFFAHLKNCTLEYFACKKNVLRQHQGQVDQLSLATDLREIASLLAPFPSLELVTVRFRFCSLDHPSSELMKQLHGVLRKLAKGPLKTRQVVGVFMRDCHVYHLKWLLDMDLLESKEYYKRLVQYECRYQHDVHTCNSRMCNFTAWQARTAINLRDNVARTGHATVLLVNRWRTLSSFLGLIVASLWILGTLPFVFIFLRDYKFHRHSFWHTNLTGLMILMMQFLLRIMKQLWAETIRGTVNFLQQNGFPLVASLVQPALAGMPPANPSLWRRIIVALAWVTRRILRFYFDIVFNVTFASACNIFHLASLAFTLFMPQVYTIHRLLRHFGDGYHGCLSSGNIFSFAENHCTTFLSSSSHGVFGFLITVFMIILSTFWTACFYIANSELRRLIRFMFQDVHRSYARVENDIQDFVNGMLLVASYVSTGVRRWVFHRKFLGWAAGTVILGAAIAVGTISISDSVASLH